MPNKQPRRKPWSFVALFKSFFSKLAPTIDQFRHLPKVLSKTERYFLLIFAFVALGSLVSMPISAYYHFTAAQPTQGGSFIEGMVGAPKYINPLLAQTSDVDRDLSKLIYAGLMKYDDNGNLVYDLADSYEISGDGLTYSFKLKDNLKWHDDQNLTADDVVFTIAITQNTDYGSGQRINWEGIDASAADSKTVIFKLKNKYAQFLSNTTIGILPKHLWESVKPASFGLSDLNIKAIGSGPYKFSKVKKDSSGNVTSYEVVSFDKYCAGQPMISKIIFNMYDSESNAIAAFNSGAIDGLSYVSAENINSVRSLGKLQLKQLRMPRYFAVFFNQNQSKVLSDKTVRLALNYATDKNAIIQDVLSGKGSVVDSPVLPGIINIKKNSVNYGYDPEKAKKLLDEASWKLPDGNNIRVKVASPPAKTSKISKTAPTATQSAADASERLEINLTTSNWPELTAVANQLKSQWEKIGIGVNIEVLALPELQNAIKNREYQSLLFGEVIGLDPDPFSFWHSSQKKDPGLNLALYDNKDADAALKSAREILDLKTRFDKYAYLQEIIINDAPGIFLYSPDYIYALPNSVKNFNTKIISIPSDRFGDISKWYINTQREFKK